MGGKKNKQMTVSIRKDVMCGSISILQREPLSLDGWTVVAAQVPAPVENWIRSEAEGLITEIFCATDNSACIDVSLPFEYERDDGQNGPPVDHALTLDVNLNVNGLRACITQRYRFDEMVMRRIKGCYEDAGSMERWRIFQRQLRSLANCMDSYLSGDATPIESEPGREPGS